MDAPPPGLRMTRRAGCAPSALHGLTPSAHDMAREYRVVAALGDTLVPGGAQICQTGRLVLGAPFQVVEFVRRVRRRAELRSAWQPFGHRGLCRRLDPLVDLYSIEFEGRRLSDFGKPDGWKRQVRRCGGSQWELVQLPDDHRDADISGDCI